MGRTVSVIGHQRRTKKGMADVKSHERRLDFPKKTAKGSDTHIVIFVPSTKGAVKISPSLFRKRLLETKSFLSNKFGGFTAIKAHGGWVSGQTLIQERVVMVETYTTRNAYLKYDLTIERWLKRKKTEWEQEAMGYIYQGKMYFV